MWYPSMHLWNTTFMIVSFELKIIFFNQLKANTPIKIWSNVGVGNNGARSFISERFESYRSHITRENEDIIYFSSSRKYLFTLKSKKNRSLEIFNFSIFKFIFWQYKKKSSWWLLRVFLHYYLFYFINQFYC